MRNDWAELTGARRSPPGYNYMASMDPSGGGDVFAVCVAHWDAETKSVVVDRIESLSGGSKGRVGLDEVLRNIKVILDSYHLDTILSDQWEAQSLGLLLGQVGIDVHRQDWNLRRRQQHATTLRAIVDQGRLILPNQPRELIDDLMSLQRVYLDSGQWTVKARRSGGHHGDYADVVQSVAFWLDMGVEEETVGGRFGV